MEINLMMLKQTWKKPQKTKGCIHIFATSRSFISIFLAILLIFIWKMLVFIWKLFSRWNIESQLLCSKNGCKTPRRWQISYIKDNQQILFFHILYLHTHKYTRTQTHTYAYIIQFNERIGKSIEQYYKDKRNTWR